MPGLRCSTRDLRGSTRLLVAACGLLVVACGLIVVACMQDLVPRPGFKPGPHPALIGSAESYPLDHQGSPITVLLNAVIVRNLIK